MSAIVTGIPRVIAPSGSGLTHVPFRGRTTYLIVRGSGKLYFTSEDAAAQNNGFALASGQFAGPASATEVWVDSPSAVTIVAFIKG
jgi:hypothetical protein